MALRVASILARFHKKPTIFVPDLGREDRIALCTHQRWRWLMNDDLQRKVRSPSYDVDQLARIIVRAAGASYLTDIAKLEAGNNDVLFFTTDCGKELVARIPYGTAGPQQLCTQSEVATLDYLGNYLDIPVPRVIAWSDSKKEVGSEFIVYEKLPGEPIGEYIDGFLSLPTDEYQPRWKEVSQVLDSYAAVEAKLANVAFSQLGSLFYKEHVSPSLQAQPLYAPGVPEDAASQRFRIGPSVDRIFYRGGRATLNINRGPWKNATDQARSVVDCEVAWIKAHGATQLGRKLSGDDADVTTVLSALQSWCNVRLDSLAASLDPAICSPILWHPDSHGHNVLVSREPDGSARISGLIDWTGACVRPLYQAMDDPEYIDVPPSSLQFVSIPSHGLKLPAVPKDVRNQATEEVRREIDQEVMRVVLLVSRRQSLAKMIDRDTVRTVLSPTLRALRTVEFTVPYVWNLGLGKLLAAIAQLESTYDTVTPRPATFTWSSEVDQGVVDDAVEHASFVNRINTSLQAWMTTEDIHISRDGRVERDDFSNVVATVDRIYQRTLADAPNETGRARLRKAWPYREGGWSETAETCW